MKMKLLTICLITAVIAGSVYATKNDANLAILKNAFEALVDASGKNLKLNFTDKEGNVIADCYEVKKYIDPGKVLDKFKEIMSNVGYD